MGQDRPHGVAVTTFVFAAPSPRPCRRWLTLAAGLLLHTPPILLTAATPEPPAAVPVLGWFPPDDEVSRCRALADLHADWLAGRLPLEADRPWFRGCLIRAEWHHNARAALNAARAGHTFWIARAGGECVQAGGDPAVVLCDLIGPEAFAAGVMPPPIPAAHLYDGTP